MTPRLTKKIALADEAHSSRKFENAIEKYEKIVRDAKLENESIEKTYTLAHLYYNIARCALSLGQTPKAKTNLIQLLPLLKTIISSPTKTTPNVLASAHEMILDAAGEVQDLYSFKEIKLSFNLAKSYHSKKAEKLFYRCAAFHYYVVEKNTAEALSCIDHLIKQDDVVYQAHGYMFGATIAREEDNNKNIVKFVDPLIELYFRNKEALLLQKELISNEIFNLGTVYDDIGSYHYDPVNAMRYYKIAARMENKLAFNNLGHKYVVGEDIPINVDRAITCFRRAYVLGLQQALTDWVWALVENDRDISEILPLAEKNKMKSVFHNIGNYYFSKAKPSQTEVDEIEIGNLSIVGYEPEDAHHWDTALVDKALEYYEKGIKAGSSSSPHNIGIIYQFGFGKAKNLVKAEQYYKISAELGHPLGVIVYKRFLSKKLSKVPIAQYQSGSQPTPIFFIPETREQEKKQDAAEYEEALNQLNIKSTDRINNVLNDYYIETTQKIEEILKENIEAFDARNVVLAIHKIGCLTEKSLVKRSFHQSKVKQILSLMDVVNQHLEASRFSTEELCLIAKGLTKLHLSTEIPLLSKTLDSLYQNIFARLKEHALSEIINMIFSSIRLNKHNIFGTIVPQMISYVISHFTEAGQQDAGNFIYALAVLDCNEQVKVNPKNLPKLFDSIFKLFSFFDQGDEEKLTENEKEIATLKGVDEDYVNILLHQIYLALFYFSNKYPVIKQDVKLNKVQEKLHIYFSKKSYKTYDSFMQKQVGRVLKLYVKDVVPEKLINTLPVDFYIKLEDQKQFILEVDGPTHYLHDEQGTPTASQKQIFRNAILQQSERVPVVVAPYYEWQKYQSSFDRYHCLQSLLTPHGLSLPSEILPEFSWRAKHSTFKPVS